MIACVTPIIDKYYAVINQLGERFLKLRSDPNENDMLRKVEENEGKEKIMREELQEVINGFIDSLVINDLNFP